MALLSIIQGSSHKEIHKGCLLSNTLQPLLERIKKKESENIINEMFK